MLDAGDKSALHFEEIISNLLVYTLVLRFKFLGCLMNVKRFEIWASSTNCHLYNRHGDIFMKITFVDSLRNVDNGECTYFYASGRVACAQKGRGRGQYFTKTSARTL